MPIHAMYTLCDTIFTFAMPLPVLSRTYVGCQPWQWNIEHGCVRTRFGVNPRLLAVAVGTCIASVLTRLLALGGSNLMWMKMAVDGNRIGRREMREHPVWKMMQTDTWSIAKATCCTLDVLNNYVTFSLGRHPFFYLLSHVPPLLPLQLYPYPSFVPYCLT